MAAKLYPILSFLEKFQTIERKTYYPLVNRGDTDPEHSYSLAMVAWQIIIHDQLPLDSSLTIKYAMVHDLLETMHGDEFAFSSPEARKCKKLDEKAALKTLKSDPYWSRIAEYIERYMEQADEESKFVHGLERIVILASNLMNDCPMSVRFDKNNPVTFDKWHKASKDRILASKYLHPYYEWLIGELKKHPEQFPEDVNG